MVVSSRGQMTTSDRSFAKPLRFSKVPLASRSVSNAAIGYLEPFLRQRKDWTEVKEKKNDQLEENRFLERGLLGVIFKFQPILQNLGPECFESNSENFSGFGFVVVVPLKRAADQAFFHFMDR